MADVPKPRLPSGHAVAAVSGRLALIAVVVLAAAMVGSIAVLPVVVPAGAVVRDTARHLGDVPPLQKKLPTPPQTSVIYAADHTTPLASLVLNQNRRIVPLSAIPRSLRDAVVAIEDDRFYEHKGVDLRGIARAAVADLRSKGIAQGGSTLTQQYVKKVVTGDSRTLDRKIREAIYAVQLERRWTKDQILAAYLNQAYFGDGYYGVATAAQHYFGGKPLSKLTLSESASLAATIAAPNRYKPSKPRFNLPRRNLVLDRMYDLHFASLKAVTAAKKQRPQIRLYKPQTRQPYFVDEVTHNLLTDHLYDKALGKAGSEARKQAVFQGGLKIQTTLDLARQHEAEAAVNSRDLGRFAITAYDPARKKDVTNYMNGALASVDPRNGAVVAMVSGTNHGKSQVNLATGAGGTGFQPGSSFKVFFIVAALEEGINPAITFNAPTQIPVVAPRCPASVHYVPHNAGDGEAGTFNMYGATAHSVNTWFAQLMPKVGLAKAVEVARRMGITQAPAPGDKDYDSWLVCSLFLGPKEVTPLDMASAFGTLANNGVHCQRFIVDRILGPTGKTLFSRKPSCEQAVPQPVAAQTVDILRGVVSGGTGKAASIGRPVAGKTGTTNSNMSAFWTGFTPQLSTSVWVGFFPNPLPMQNEHFGRPVFGGTFPAEIFHDYMVNALAGQPVLGFPAPPMAAPPPPAQQGKVPNVVGQKVQQAVKTLQAAGYHATVQPVGNPAPRGIVVGQNPPAGAAVPPNTPVVLQVSKGHP